MNSNENIEWLCRRDEEGNPVLIGMPVPGPRLKIDPFASDHKRTRIFIAYPNGQVKPVWKTL